MSRCRHLSATQPTRLLTVSNEIAAYLRKRRGSCLKVGGKAIIGAGPPEWGPDLPFLPPSNGGGPPCSRNIRMATSGGAGTKGPSGLRQRSYNLVK